MKPLACPQPRLGKKQKFKNIQKAQCHCIATAAMNQSSGSVHENVFGYDPSHLEKHCDHEIDMAKRLGTFLKVSYFFGYFWVFPVLTTALTSPRLSQDFAPTALLRLAPQQFGCPTSRPREYRLTWNTRKLEWKQDP